jgi:hypothetical protein
MESESIPKQLIDNTPIVLVGEDILLLWGGVRLSALGTSATNWPIVPAPDDR